MLWRWLVACQVAMAVWESGAARVAPVAALVATTTLVGAGLMGVWSKVKWALRDWRRVDDDDTQPERLPRFRGKRRRWASS